MLEHVVAPVVEVLAELSPGLPDVLVVGAVCRDALHLAAGHDPSLLRITDDLDIALAVDGWDHYETITARLEPMTGAGSAIRYRIAGHPVDIVPFGDPVESPDGVVTSTRRDVSMSVFGFQDVWASAYQVQLNGTITIRVPTAPGYTLLKLKAWADRAVVHQYKDAPDLATAMYWYQEDVDLIDARLWDSPTGLELLSEVEFDVPEAAVRLLVADARAVLAGDRQEELATVWRSVVSDDALADNLANSSLRGWPGRGDARLSAYARAVRRGIVE